jgi:hypothetical protein
MENGINSMWGRHSWENPFHLGKYCVFISLRTDFKIIRYIHCALKERQDTVCFTVVEQNEFQWKI